MYRDSITVQEEYVQSGKVETGSAQRGMRTWLSSAFKVFTNKSYSTACFSTYCITGAANQKQERNQGWRWGQRLSSYFSNEICTLFRRGEEPHGQWLIWRDCAVCASSGGAVLPSWSIAAQGRSRQIEAPDQKNLKFVNQTISRAKEEESHATPELICRI